VPASSSRSRSHVAAHAFAVHTTPPSSRSTKLSSCAKVHHAFPVKFSLATRFYSSPRTPRTPTTKPLRVTPLLRFHFHLRLLFFSWRSHSVYSSLFFYTLLFQLLSLSMYCSLLPLFPRPFLPLRIPTPPVSQATAPSQNPSIFLAWPPPRAPPPSPPLSPAPSQRCRRTPDAPSTSRAAARYSPHLLLPGRSLDFDPSLLGP
jgi:hypothetical protein